jgi:hypothetical protein
MERLEPRRERQRFARPREAVREHALRRAVLDAQRHVHAALGREPLDDEHRPELREPRDRLSGAPPERFELVIPKPCDVAVVESARRHSLCADDGREPAALRITVVVEGPAERHRRCRTDGARRAGNHSIGRDRGYRGAGLQKLASIGHVDLVLES